MSRKRKPAARSRSIDAETLRYARLALGLTQRQLAVRLGEDPAMVVAWERPERGVPESRSAKVGKSLGSALIWSQRERLLGLSYTEFLARQEIGMGNALKLGSYLAANYPSTETDIASHALSTIRQLEAALESAQQDAETAKAEAEKHRILTA